MKKDQESAVTPTGAGAPDPAANPLTAANNGPSEAHNSHVSTARSESAEKAAAQATAAPKFLNGQAVVVDRSSWGKADGTFLSQSTRDGQEFAQVLVPVRGDVQGTTEEISVELDKVKPLTGLAATLHAKPAAQAEKSKEKE